MLFQRECSLGEAAILVLPKADPCYAQGAKG